MNDSAELLARYQGGDESAAEEIFLRYVDRLTLLARSRLSAKLAQRVDPEDVVLSAYRSFFLRARDGAFSLERSGDLWRLLVAVTLRKVFRQAERHQAEKRSVHRETSLESLHDPSRLAREPSPHEAAVLAEEFERLTAGLSELERRILEMRLRGHSVDEIAADAKRTERTVRRVLARLQASWESDLLSD
ncbi:MAG: ECF-type sigma factor [Planctomycetales bacterium]